MTVEGERRVVNTRDEIWSEGDVVRYHDMKPGKKEPQYCKVHAGLFWLSGWGMGHLFTPQNTIEWCSVREAAEKCRQTNTALRVVDSLINTH